MTMINVEIESQFLNPSPDGVWYKILERGVYQIGHFNFDIMAAGELENYPEFEMHNSYGVCDSYRQILDQYPELQDPEREFVISVTEIRKEYEPSEGGWRWHKWGAYIGEQNPTHEYLYDEADIESVYCYHIYERTENQCLTQAQ